MKIVFLSRFQNKTERGAENFVNEISKRLIKNHKVDILSGDKADSLELIFKGDYDLVIPINGRLQSLKASLGRIFGKYKLLITGHSGIGRDDIWNIAISKPDVFIALTEYSANWAKHWAWGTKVLKISNGVDLDKFKLNGKKMVIDLPKPIILSVGALTWYKNHDLVINAVSKLSEVSVLIVGDGPDKKRLEDLGRKLLGNRFKIIKVEYKDMPNIYRSVDLFTLPSWDREAFGLVYLEALASGLGVVAPDDSVRREIIGEGGLFIDPKNIEEYAKRIEEALGIDWQKKSREQAEKFSWDLIADKYEKVMLDLVK